MSPAPTSTRRTGPAPADKAGKGGAPAEAPRGGKRKKRLKFWLVWLPLILLTVMLLPSIIAEGTTYALSSGHCHETPEDCPEGCMGLVLGCSKLLGKGRPNYYFEGRMDAAAELWKSGKVSHLIVSGDNSSRYYNEPADMKNALIRRGVPADRIICDYAGIRTYDSVLRARDIFLADKLIIVSQPEHVQRAVAIARFSNIEAEGLYAPLQPIPFASSGKQRLRERGARIAMIIDFIISRNPKYMGDKVPINRHTQKKGAK